MFGARLTVGMEGFLKWEVGLRPVGAIGAYAPEGMRNWEIKDYGNRKLRR